MQALAQGLNNFPLQHNNTYDFLHAFSDVAKFARFGQQKRKPCSSSGTVSQKSERVDQAGKNGLKNDGFTVVIKMASCWFVFISSTLLLLSPFYSFLGATA